VFQPVFTDIGDHQFIGLFLPDNIKSDAGTNATRRADDADFHSLSPVGEVIKPFTLTLTLSPPCVKTTRASEGEGKLT
jgi:hypothetical protein